MSKQSNPQSPKEQSAPERLLYSREQVAAMLGNVSIATIRRLESEGRLKPIRLSRSPTAMVFFRAKDVQTLIAEAAN